MWPEKFPVLLSVSSAMSHTTAPHLYCPPCPSAWGFMLETAWKRIPQSKPAVIICPPVVQAAWESKTQNLMNQCIWENTKCQNNNRIFLKMCMSIIYVCECFAKILYAWCLGRSEESIRSLETGVLDAYKLLCEAGNRTEDLCYSSQYSSARSHCSSLQITIFLYAASPGAAIC